jgi:hypothetical protein
MSVKERHVEFDQIPDVSSKWVTCVAHASINEIDEVLSNSGKSMLVVTFQGIEPRDIAGLTRLERYVIGTDEDPEAMNPATLQGTEATYGLRLFKKMLAKAGIPFNSNSLATTCAASIGAQLLFEVKHTVDDGKSDPKYAGYVRDEIKNYFRLGERAPEVLPCSCPDCSGQPVSNDAAIDKAMGPTPAAPAPAASAPKASKKATVAPSAPAPASPSAPAPVAPAAPVPPAPQPVASPSLQQCPICKGMVAEKDIVTHVAACAAAHTAGFKDQG